MVKAIAQIVVFLGYAGMTMTMPLSATAAADARPQTFSRCVLAGGDVRLHGDMSCRFVRSIDLRIYMTAETECGEMVDIEIWDVTRCGVITYAFDPDRTIELREEWLSWPYASPIPCLDD